MQKYQNNVLSPSGDVVPYASVTITQFPSGTAATIYSDNGATVQANPITTDVLGNFAFYAADGRYTATVTGATVTTASIIDILLDDTAASTQAIAIVLNGATPIAMASTAIRATGSVDSPLQVDIRNASTGVNASSDFVATASNGTDTTQFANFGINGQNYAAVTWTINGARDAYLYASDGALAIGTAAAQEICFFTGGTLLANKRMLISGIGDVVIKINSSAPVLTVNSQMVFALTSNTSLRIQVRGTDGVTRGANVVLA